MESLCRMNKPTEGWELIIFEDEVQSFPADFIDTYRGRLRDVGCINVLYEYLSYKKPLSQKWIHIANMAAETSEYFCLCAADNYYSPHMLQDAEQDIKEADWTIFVQGYFYDFYMNKVFRYNFPSRVGLQMTARTKKVRDFPMDVVNKGVDMWFSRQIGYDIKINDSEHWQEILCTNGMNTISTERKEFFEDPHPPFYETSKSLITIVPIDIYSRLKTLSQCLKLQ
jgi:hypothetical protein